MPIEDATFTLATVQWLMMVVIGIYAWWVGRQSATLAEVVALRERVIELEMQMKNTPSQHTMAEMLARLERLDANTEATTQALRPINANLDRINQYLLNHK